MFCGYLTDNNFFECYFGRDAYLTDNGEKFVEYFGERKKFFLFGSITDKEGKFFRCEINVI